MPAEGVRLAAASLIAAGRFTWARLRNRADREHEMSFNRLAFAALITASLYLGERIGSRYALNLMGAYTVLAFGILVHLLVYPAVSPARRCTALLVDIVFLSWQLHLGSEASAAFFPIYLWVSFGNGFRFGLTWLRIAMVASFVGFATVVLTTPFWSSKPHLSIGLLASLLVLPAYAGTLISRLSKARQQAEHANEAKTLFLAGVSHELRTPLTAIIGMGGMLRTTRLDASQQEMSGTIQDAATSLLSLITSILDFVQIEAGRMPVDVEVFDLPALLRETRSLVAAQAFTKGLTVALHIDARLPIQIACNRRNLSDILVNLVANAVKFTDQGSVIIVARATAPADGTTRLSIKVIDSGIGIAADAQARIFESFTQADPTIRHRYGGTGLGLALARRRAELLGGSLQVRSVEGHGAEFELDVEVAVPPQSIEQPDRRLAAIICGPGSPRREAVSARLAENGVKVTTGSETRRSLTRDGVSATSLSLTSVLLIVDDPSLPAFEPSTEALGLLASVPGLPCVILPAASRTTLDHLAWPINAWLSFDETEAALGAALKTAHSHSRNGSVPDAGDDQPLPAIPRHILDADDNAVNRRVLSKILETAGHIVTAVVDGEVALDTLEHSSKRFDLVLMDMNMPVMDGLEATKLYRFIALGQPHLPIVGLTADATPEAAERCLEAGMDLCVTKPIMPAALLSLVAQLTDDIDQGASPPKPPAPDVTRLVRPADEVVNVGMMTMLEQLGGQEFLYKLINDFLAEAAETTKAIMEAISHADHLQFRSTVHALHSSAANLGAQSLTNLCNAWQRLSTAEFAAQKEQFPGRLEAELDRTRDALLSFRATLVC